VTRWIELIAEAGPFARSIEQNQTGNGAGGLALGLQGVVYHGEAARTTIALSYLRQVYGGDTPDLDIGSATNSFLFLARADLKGFHYDAICSSTTSSTTRFTVPSSGRRSRSRMPSQRG